MCERGCLEGLIVQNNLRGDHDGRGSCAEITDGKITKSAIERTMMGGGDINLQSHAKTMYVLRVGKIPQGESAPRCTAINNDKIELPGMNYAGRGHDAVAERKVQQY